MSLLCSRKEAVEDVGVAERGIPAVSDTNDDNFDFDNFQEAKEEEKRQVPSSEENPKGGGKVNGEKMYFEATETPNSVGEDLCELCGEKLTLKNELINHTEKAHAKKADNCSKCGKNNQSLKFPTSHIRTVHKVQRFYVNLVVKSLH